MTVNNSTKHIDRRIVRTRRAIHIAFIDLLTEYEYTKITITALAKRAEMCIRDSHSPVLEPAQ